MKQSNNPPAEPAIYDKRGIPILPGDTVKVFHFRSRGRDYYMYKYVVKVWRHEKWGEGVDSLVFSHLNPRNETYFIMRNGQIEPDYEIVQGYEGVVPGQDYRSRKRRKP